MCTYTSVTRLGDLLNFGQVLKPFATMNLPKSPPLLGNFCKDVKIYHFSTEKCLGNFCRHLAIFTGHTAHVVCERLGLLCICQRSITSDLLDEIFGCP